MLFSFSGIVKKHLRRGTMLGFPTANIEVEPETPEGIFVGFANVDSRRFQSLIFVGKPLTFDEQDKKAEVYLLDFDDNLYNKKLEINVLFKLRENIKFSSKDTLVAQIKEDERQARDYFSNFSKMEL
ncbi:hypothetical protein COV58_02315 [Candidatus Roizmanbacteria bacterium CG11_big_fil_rev_8_21_14_0_20_36_8]|uniref:riboflavin kinase n=1 Tax=Candidatus Roizmanbacteria bacterium CG11_big_fil_rev_8_21_14_0_20_36_8 TaxID=1974856 RepID=A0A2M6IUA2_9BACT|nr:MAG: hypothetical protein COV58_02315 [Candidatus Roizmanbacteria bacterium CG11_big_fil_rev_8_21_14_0_20_36_8]